MNIPIIQFNGGEFTPQIDARADLEKYKSGCRRLKNMLPRIYGTAERRPGTKYIQRSKYQDVDGYSIIGGDGLNIIYIYGDISAVIGAGNTVDSFDIIQSTGNDWTYVLVLSWGYDPIYNRTVFYLAEESPYLWIPIYDGYVTNIVTSMVC